MRAAVVRDFGRPPRYEEYRVPSPEGASEELVTVVAAGLHPRVKSGAAGRHYSSSGTLPMIPGIDGVARRSDGTLAYFLASDDVWGSMAELAVLDRQRSIDLPAGADPVAVAAMMNPAMSSWVALRQRGPATLGSVLVLGATGSAGSLAVQVAARLGARTIIGVGRDPERLRHLTTVGATSVVSLTSDDVASELSAVANDVDVVLDYLWGEPALTVMATVVAARTDSARAVDWIEVGAIAGSTMELPAAALRSTNLRILGSGQGSVAPQLYRDELPSLIAEIAAGTFTLDARPRPLDEVEDAWSIQDPPGTRTVLMPSDGTEGVTRK